MHCLQYLYLWFGGEHMILQTLHWHQFFYFRLSLSWLMYFSVMTLIVYDIVFVVHDIVFELLTRSLGLDSASTNISFTLYYFRFLAVKRQIQHQQETRNQDQIQGKLRNRVYYLHNFSNIPFCLNADSLQRKMISGYA